MMAEQRAGVKRGAVKHALRLLLQRIIGIGFFVFAAGTLRDMRGLSYIALYLVTSLIGIIIMLFGYQETLNAREQVRASSKGFDQILLPIVVLMVFFGMYIAAGLGIRFGWKRLSMGWFYAGIVLYLISAVFTTWPVLENKHFEGTSRIQDEREHTVVTTGPYRIVRHPGYTGLIIWAIASFFIFGTLAVGIVSAIVIVAISIRTYYEDTMLKEELEGYAAYSQQTRYRLIPFIW